MKQKRKISKAEATVNVVKAIKDFLKADGAKAADIVEFSLAVNQGTLPCQRFGYAIDWINIYNARVKD